MIYTAIASLAKICEICNGYYYYCYYYCDDKRVVIRLILREVTNHAYLKSHAIENGTSIEDNYRYIDYGGILDPLVGRDCFRPLNNVCHGTIRQLLDARINTSNVVEPPLWRYVTLYKMMFNDRYAANEP